MRSSNNQQDKRDLHGRKNFEFEIINKAKICAVNKTEKLSELKQHIV